MFFAKRAFLPAAFLVFATDAALASPTPAPLHILCDPAAPADICAGLRDAMVQRFPDRSITIVAAPTDAGAATIRMITKQIRPDTVSGHLTWTLPDGNSGESRPIELSVIDAPLTPAMLRDFGANLAAFFTQ